MTVGASSSQPTISTRPAASADATEMAELLNEIIAIGGTTAYETPFTPEALDDLYISSPDVLSCFVAIDDDRVVGFQGLFRPIAEDPMPDGWAFIATFAQTSSAGKGVGRRLFAETLKAARGLGVRVIDATIRADNAGGLAFYERMGFCDYGRIEGIALKDGSLIDKVRKRYDLGRSPLTR